MPVDKWNEAFNTCISV